MNQVEFLVGASVIPCENLRTVGFRAYYVFVILEHGSRRIRHWNITESPSLEWIIQQLREATPYGEVPRFIHRDNDGLYGKGVSMFQNHRLHQGLAGRRPCAKQHGPSNAGEGEIISIPVLGGLHHRYERIAA